MKSTSRINFLQDAQSTLIDRESQGIVNDLRRRNYTPNEKWMIKELRLMCGVLSDPSVATMVANKIKSRSGLCIEPEAVVLVSRTVLAATMKLLGDIAAEFLATRGGRTNSQNENADVLFSSHRVSVTALTYAKSRPEVKLHISVKTHTVDPAGPGGILIHQKTDVHGIMQTLCQYLDIGSDSILDVCGICCALIEETACGHACIRLMNMSNAYKELATVPLLFGNFTVENVSGTSSSVTVDLTATPRLVSKVISRSESIAGRTVRPNILDGLTKYTLHHAEIQEISRIASCS